MTRKFVYALLICCLPTMAFGDLEFYSQDFESMTPALDVPSNTDPGATDISDDGWFVNGIAWGGDPGDKSTFLYFYGNFPAPNFNGNPGFSGVIADQGTGNQGNRHLNVYSDYGNGDAHSTNNQPNYVEARVFQEQQIAAGDVGSTWDLDFEFKRNNEGGGDLGPDGLTQTYAYVRVLRQSDNSFATIGEVQFETTNALLGDWTAQTISLLIDPSFSGELLQFGFYSEAKNGQSSGILYDNVQFQNSAIPEPNSAALIVCFAVGAAALRRRRK